MPFSTSVDGIQQVLDPSVDATFGLLFTMNQGRPLATKTTTYTLTLADDILLANAVTAGFTITLPTAVGITGANFTIKKIDATTNVVTIATTSSQTIDGVTTRTINTQYEAVEVVSNGTNWHII